jgi:uncharacterized membrane protein
MRQQDVPTRGPARPGPYIVVAALLVLGIVLPLVVPIYARDEPRLIGLPFFYWYQMLCVVVCAVLTAVVYFATDRD